MNPFASRNRPALLPFLLLTFCPLFLAGSASGAEPAPQKTGEATALPFEPVDFKAFRVFVRNWESGENGGKAEGKAPPLLGILRSVAEWEEVFHPAPVMRNSKPFAPERARFEKSQLLFAARVTTPPPEGTSAMEVESVTLKDGEVSFRYRFKTPGPASFQVKETVGVWIPKGPYRKILFIENGKPAGSLDLAKGEWVNPVLPEEPR